MHTELYGGWGGRGEKGPSQKMLKNLLWTREAPQKNLTKISRTPPLDVEPSYPIDFQLRCNNRVHMSDKIYFENNLD